MLNDALQTAVKGVITLNMLTDNWPTIKRHVCDTPRNRKRRSTRDLTAMSTACDALS